jgi:hypothetical protein
MTFGRRAFLGYSSRLNRVYVSTDCVFEEQLFPYRLVDHHIYGYHNNMSDLEQQILYHNMSNTTIEDIATHIQAKAVSHKSTLLQIPAAFETDIPDPVASEDTPGSGDTSDSGDTPNSEDSPITGDHTTHPSTTLSDPVGNTLALSQTAGTSATDLHRTIFAHGPSGVYGELPKPGRHRTTRK